MWCSAVGAPLVWVKASRRRKASNKWKKVITEVEGELKMKKKRRLTMMKQSQSDIAHLLQIGCLHHAFSRVEQLYKDKCLLGAYDLIEHFCECILTTLSDICNHSCVQNLPMNVREAIASVICGASRCGELQQLHVMRRILREKYGREFDAENVELRAGNFVNSQLKQLLCIRVVPQDEKLKLMEEIAQNNSDLSQRLIKEFKHFHFNPQLQNQDHAMEERAEAMDIEMQESYYSNKDETNQRKVIATPPPREFHNYTTSSDSSSSSEGLNLGKADYPEAVSSGRTSSSEGMSRTPNMSSIVCLDDDDDTEEKEKEMKKKMGLEDRRSLDSSIEKLKGVRHVHPNLPEFEEVVAKLRDVRVRGEPRRQRKGFPF